MKKRLLSLFLCITLVFSLLTACDNTPVTKPSDKGTSSDVSSDSTEQDETTNVESSDSPVMPLTRTEYIEEKIAILNEGERLEGDIISLFPNGKIAFRLIRSSEATREIISYAAEIKSEIKERLDVTAEYKPDSVAEVSGKMEVLVGETNRAGYKEIYDDLVNYRKNYHFDWTIKVVGDKIFIVGGSPVALEDAVDYFIERFCSSLGAIITSEYVYKYKHKTESSFTVNGSTDLSKYKIIMPVYNMSYIIGRELPNVSAALLRYNLSDVKVLTDKEPVSNYEIVVGSTNRGSFSKIIDKDIWQISVKGSKIYLEGGQDASTAIAVLKFIEMIKTGKALKDGDKITGKYSETMKEETFKDYFNLTLADEFEEATLNDKIWGVEHINSQYEPEELFNLDGSNRKSGRNKDNVALKDGKLVGSCTYDDDTYWGFSVLSNNKLLFQYGLLEISAKLPIGEGLWSGFWLLSPNMKGYTFEFDIFETFSLVPEGIKQSALLWGTMTDKSAYNGVNQNLGSAVKDEFTWNLLGSKTDINEYYHTFGIEWDEDQYTMFCDGRALYTVDYSNNEELLSVFHQLAYIRLSAVVDLKTTNSSPYDEIKGSAHTGCIPGADYWSKSNEMIIEYLRLYQKPGSKLVIK